MVERDGDVWRLAGSSCGVVRAGERVPGLSRLTGTTRRGPVAPTRSICWCSPVGWSGRGLALTDVDTDVLLRFLTACREATLPGRPGGNVYSIRDGRNSGYAPSDDQPAAGGDLGAVRVPARCATRRWRVRCRGAGRRGCGRRGERSGLLAHVAKPKPRSQLRVREPRRLPRGLSRQESAALLGSFRTWRDRAIAGLMLLSGLRSAEVLALRVR